VTSVIAKETEKLLNQKKKEIIFPLEKVYGKSFPFSTIKVYLTTAPIFPYNYEERWFMLGRNNDAQKHLATAKHELNHFMFYFYYWDQMRKKRISAEKREKLKEALVILTNPEGNDKPDVKKLEEYLKTLKGKSMDEIIEQVLGSGML